MTSAWAYLNPACARLRDDSLQLYPRMVARGTSPESGRFAPSSTPTGRYASSRAATPFEPEAPYELRDATGGYGCEDPRVTFLPVLDRYVMSYVAFGPRGPEVAVAVSSDGLAWQRLGLLRVPADRRAVCR